MTRRRPPRRPPPSTSSRTSCALETPRWHVSKSKNPKEPDLRPPNERFTVPPEDPSRTPRRETTSPQLLSASAFPITISSSFHSLFRVLFTFPSQYFSAIGLTAIFSFGWGQPPVLGLQSQTTRLEEALTRLETRCPYRAVTFFGTPFQAISGPRFSYRVRESENYNSMPL